MSWELDECSKKFAVKEAVTSRNSIIPGGFWFLDGKRKKEVKIRREKVSMEKEQAARYLKSHMRTKTDVKLISWR